MTRPKNSPGGGILIETGCGTLNVLYRFYEDKLQEVFCIKGKSGGCIGSQTEALGRLVSLLLHNEVKIAEIIKQLKGIRCASQHMESLSCSDALAKALEEITEIQIHEEEKVNGTIL